MRTLFTLLDDPLAHRVGWGLLHSLWQGAVVGAVFALARAGLGRRRPELRYAAGCVALGLLLAGPLLTLGYWPAIQPRPITLPSAEVLTWQAGPAQALAPQGTTVGSAATSGPGLGGQSVDFFQRASGLCEEVSPLLAAAWLVGVGICLWRLSRGCWWVRKLRTREVAAVPEGCLEVLEDLRQRLAISRPVRLLQSALVEVPTVIGWLRPVILLPAATLAGLTPEQLEAILAHELAHVRRLDYLVNAAQCAVETLLFYHPVVWWVSRCVREEREHCCDDLVVRVCGNRLVYARALAALEEARPDQPRFAFAANGAPLVGRIRRLLGVGEECGAASIRQLCGLTLLLVGLLLLVSGVSMLCRGGWYLASARLQVEPEREDASGAPLRAPRATLVDPYFMPTQVELLRSRSILEAAAERYQAEGDGMTNASAGVARKGDEVARLKSRTVARAIPNTHLLEIQVLDEDRQRAARFANAVARAYVEYRRTLRDASAGAVQMGLAEQIHMQERELKVQQELVDQLRTKLNVPSWTAGDGPTEPQENPRRINVVRIESQAELMRQTTLLQNLRAMSREQLVDVLPTAAQDNLLGSLLEQKALADQKLIAVQKDYGPAHPEVAKARSQATDLEEKIQKRADGILAGLAAKVQSLAQGLTNLLTEVKRAEAEEVARIEESRPYYDAKRVLAGLVELHQAMLKELQSASLSRKLALDSGPLIIDLAVPPEIPLPAGRSLALSLIAAGLLLDLLGLVVMRR